VRNTPKSPWAVPGSVCAFGFRLGRHQISARHDNRPRLAWPAQPAIASCCACTYSLCSSLSRSDPGLQQRLRIVQRCPCTSFRAIEIACARCPRRRGGNSSQPRLLRWFHRFCCGAGNGISQRLGCGLIESWASANRSPLLRNLENGHSLFRSLVSLPVACRSPTAPPFRVGHPHYRPNPFPL